MTEQEIEQFIVENQVRPKYVSAEMLAEIMRYKSNHIKAHIPAWVFEETYLVFLQNWGKFSIAWDRRITFNWDGPTN